MSENSLPFACPSLQLYSDDRSALPSATASTAGIALHSVLCSQAGMAAPAGKAMISYAGSHAHPKRPLLRCRKPAAADASKMDALVLAHTAALHLAFQHCPAECSAADVLMNNWRCPDICLPVAVAAGAAAVVQLADDRQKKQVGYGRYIRRNWECLLLGAACP